MGLYFSLISKNGEVIIDKVKVLFIGTIWDTILKQNGVLKEDEYMGYNGCDDEYVIDINEFPKIVGHYEEMINGFSDDEYGGSVGIIRHMLLEPLKEELEFRISEYKEYIIKIE